MASVELAGCSHEVERPLTLQEVARRLGVPRRPFTDIATAARLRAVTESANTYGQEQ